MMVRGAGGLTISPTLSQPTSAYSLLRFDRNRRSLVLARARSRSLQALRCFGCEPEGRLLLCKPCQEARHWGLPAHELTIHRCVTAICAVYKLLDTNTYHCSTV